MNAYNDVLKAAEDLKYCLKSSSVKDASDLLAQVDSFIKSLKDEMLPISSRDIPGSKKFLEGYFRHDKSLEESYAKFQLACAGGVSDEKSQLILKRLRDLKGAC